MSERQREGEALSVAVITLNEADRLPACLASAADVADEMVVVDAGSTDQTRELARRAGAKVVVRSWEGFGQQKQFAVSQCRHHWVLVLDADERLSAEAAGEIASVLRQPRCAAYSLPRKNLFCGHWLRHGGWWPDRVVRLFDRRWARFSDRLVHESVIVDGPVGELAAPIVHLANRDLHHTLEKINRYSTAGARQMADHDQRASLMAAVAHGAWAFVHDYVLRRGMLDGGPGFVQAVCNAVNVFFKYAKCWEMRGRGTDGRSDVTGHMGAPSSAAAASSRTR